MPYQDWKTVVQMIPPWFLKPENQSLLMAGAMLMTAWFVLSWLVRVVMSLLWPLSLLLVAMMLVSPDSARWLLYEVLPPYYEIFKSFTTNIFTQANQSVHSGYGQ